MTTSRVLRRFAVLVFLAAWPLGAASAQTQEWFASTSTQSWEGVTVSTAQAEDDTAADEAAGEEAGAGEQGGGEDGGGAAASNPTAGVNYLDTKPRFVDLPEGDEEYVLEIEGVYTFSPSFTLKYELIGVHTDKSGEWKTGLREGKLRGLFLKPFKPLGVDAKFGVGVEWFQDLGSSSDGKGTGTNRIAPLIGIGWIPTPEEFLVTLVQYFHSYHEDSGFEAVRATGPRIIYIRALPSIEGWGKIDLRMRMDHKDDNNFSQTLELQLGTMISDTVGIFGELFIGDNILSTNEYDKGIGVGLRILY